MHTKEEIDGIMDNRERNIKRWKNNDNMDLMDMYNKCNENGWCDYKVVTQEDLREFIKKCIDNIHYCAPLLQSVENDTAADLFIFDYTGWSNNPAKPIYNKDELADAII